jgi:hypothetical protein
MDVTHKAAAAPIDVRVSERGARMCRADSVQPRFSIRTRRESEQDVEDVREKAKILRRRSSLYVDA